MKRRYLFTFRSVSSSSSSGDLKVTDLWLQNASFSVEIKRSPATGPASVDKQQCDAFNSVSPSLTSNFCLKIFFFPPSLIFFASNFIESERPTDLTAINIWSIIFFSEEEAHDHWFIHSKWKKRGEKSAAYDN